MVKKEDGTEEQPTNQPTKQITMSSIYTRERECVCERERNLLGAAATFIMQILVFIPPLPRRSTRPSIFVALPCTCSPLFFCCLLFYPLRFFVFFAFLRVFLVIFVCLSVCFCFACERGGGGGGLRFTPHLELFLFFFLFSFFYFTVTIRVREGCFGRRSGEGRGLFSFIFFYCFFCVFFSVSFF